MIRATGLIDGFTSRSALVDRTSSTDSMGTQATCHEPRHRVFVGTVLTAVLLACFAAPSVVVAADELDSLNEDLRVSTARLQYAMDKLRSVHYALGGDDRRTLVLVSTRFELEHLAELTRREDDKNSRSRSWIETVPVDIPGAGWP